VQRTLEDGCADAIFPVAIKAERRNTMDFSQLLLMSGGALLVRAPAATPKGLSWLGDKVIFTLKTGPLASFIAKNVPGAKLIVTADYDESLARLVNGEADAAAPNWQVGAMLAAKWYPGRITPADRLFLELPHAVATVKGRVTCSSRSTTPLCRCVWTALGSPSSTAGSSACRVAGQSRHYCKTRRRFMEEKPKPD